ncbi:MAG: hypothetical protein ACRCTZ_20475, partial [Sarcina sp.]
FWKILKYPTYDCISKPNLTIEEKSMMIWKNQDNSQDYNIFFNNVVDNMILDSKTLLKLYKFDGSPETHIVSTLSYQFDFLYGTKISIIDYYGIPCNRGDALEAEILKTLNGVEVSGVGMLQYNRRLSRLCRSFTNYGNSSTFSGNSIVMATLSSDLSGDSCGG